MVRVKICFSTSTLLALSTCYRTMDAFYVTLPSNSSMSVFPNNTLTHYYTQLAKPLQLNGVWEVAMTSISYPHSWYDIDENGGAITYQFSPEEPEQRFTLSTTIVSGEKSILVERLNMDSNKCLIFHVNKNERMEASLSCSTPYPNWSIGATGRLATLLGWHEMRPIGSDGIAEGSQPIDDSPIHQLFVYTDIIDNQRVGDVNAPLLRRVPVEKIFPQVVNLDFINKEYHLVNTTLINTIEIDIRDDIGEPIPFEMGHVHITLHFRQKRSVLL